MTYGRIFALAVAVLVITSCAAAPPADGGPPAPPLSPALEAQMRQVPVTMYMTAWCPVCAKARAWLREGGYRFVERDIERDPMAADIVSALNPHGTVPMFDVDGQIVIGFEPRLLRFVLRRAVEVDSGGAMGYAAAR